MQAAERSYIYRQRSVAILITVSITAVQSHKPDVDADEMSKSRRSPSLISISVGVEKLHGSLRSFSLTGTIFLSIPSLLARIRWSRSQYFTSRPTNHLSCGFNTTFTEGLLQKASMSIRPPLIGSTVVTSHAAVKSDARSIQIYSQNIRICC